ncbi:MAG: hypothetical protein CMN30_24045 [Sandaracinus sp.]|nr:hypothetical protein [Sandaracinus sp.]|tara:strand:+ start:55 stop:522 length:468 start_codon:yes stop_codon:yes gene_type:complete
MFEVDPRWTPSEVVANWFEVVWNQKHVEAIPHLFVGKASGVHPEDPGPAVQAEAFADAWRLFQSNIDDLRVELVDCLEIGKRGAARYRLTGIHRATRKPVEFEGAGFFTCSVGRIVDAWNLVDFLALAQQVDEGLGADAPVRVLAGKPLTPLVMA